MLTNDIPQVSQTGKYTITQTANALGCHRNSVRNWLQAGTLRAMLTRNGSRVYIKGSEILRFWRTN